MMDNVKLFRIDYRLMHYQTSVLFVNKLNINLIIVAGDGVANDTMRKNILKMAAPSGVKFRVFPIEETVRFLNSEAVKKYSVELLVENTDDALALVEKVPYLRELNAGIMKSEKGKRLLTKYLAIDDHDIENFKKMIDMGVDIECYTVPTEAAVNITKYL